MRLTSNSLLLSLSFLLYSHAWAAIISFLPDARSAYRCMNAAPGYCCKYPIPTPIALGASAVQLTGLPHGAISVIWSWDNAPNLPARDSACDELVLDTSGQTPSWTYVAPEPHRGWATRRMVTGAKYFDCPVPHPGRGWEHTLVDLCTKLGVRGWRKRAIKTRKPAMKEKTWGYPDEIDFNGTTYTDGGRNDLVYRDSMGRILDLNLLRGEDK